jgi:transcriptional regulator with XRE-family HTH domain
MTTLRILLAENIRKRRNFLGISQAQLAERVKTSPNYIAQIEQQKRFPKPEMLERIAIALEIESPQLFSQEKSNDEIIKQFQENFLLDIGKAVTAAAKEKLKEL